MSANGNDAQRPAATPTPQEVAAANALLAQIQPTIKVVMAVALRGLMASSPGVRADLVASMACFELGQTIGQTFGGDLAAVLQIRKTCQEAFAEGLRKSPAPKPALLQAQQLPEGMRGGGGAG